MLLLPLLLAAPAPPQEAEAPAPELHGPAVVYRVDRIETLKGEALRNATVVVRDGVIEKMGTAIIEPEDAEVHDLRGTGSTILPPLVLTHADFLVADSRGRGRFGRYTGWDSLWVDEEDLERLLEHGVLLAGVDPPGSGIPGRTSVIAATGTAPRPRPVVRDLYLKLTIDADSSAKEILRKAFADVQAAEEKERKAREEWEKARKEWEAKQKARQEAEKKKQQGGGEGDGKAAGSGRAQDGGEKEQGQAKEEKPPPEKFEPPPIDPDLLPVVEWVHRERPAQIWIESAAEWLHWLDVLGDRDLPWEVVLSLPRWGSPHPQTNLHEVVADITGRGGRVYLPARLTLLPDTRIRSNLPAEFQRAGATLVLLPPFQGWAGLERWRAALAEVVAEGLDRETALRAITVEAAAALGQEERVRPLETGGPATFVVLDGDVLDPTAEVEFVLEEGVVRYDREWEEQREENRR